MKPVVRPLACTAMMPLLHLCGAPLAAADDGDLWDRLRGGGYVLVVRLPVAPGAPAAVPSSRGGCVTQHESGDETALAAQRIGDALRERGIPVAKVMVPPGCALRETARLAFGSAEPWTTDDGESPSRQWLAQSLAGYVPAQGNLVFVTDKRTISELTGRTVTVGEFVVLAVDAGRLGVRGQLQASR